MNVDAYNVAFYLEQTNQHVNSVQRNVKYYIEQSWEISNVNSVVKCLDRRSQHKKYGLGRYEIQFWRDRAFQPSPHLTKAHKIKRPVDFTIPGGNRRLFHSL